ncbi:hypothetical protein T439DRAFT_323988 [Meredithblackwellia eburnea MCA 4105]
MQSARPKAVVWDPRPGSSRFVIGGGSELRMYKWEEGKSLQDSRATTLAVVSELSQLRTFAWSPHQSLHDLVAVGLTTGRTLLLRLDASASPSAVRQAQEGVVPTVSAVQINVRHSRPCNVVAFCSERPGLLAIGLEKARGESLLLFDIEASASTLEGGRGGSSSTYPQSHNHSTIATSSRLGLNRNASPSASVTHGASSAVSTPGGASTEPQPLVQMGSSETVTSAAWLACGSTSNTGPILVAGMGGKWLRAYDLRSPQSPAATWGSRSILSISANPFNGYQFTSHGDDGIVKLWDLRKSSDPLLSFSEVDACANPPTTRVRPSSVSAKPLADMAWSPTRRGVFATLEKDSNCIRVWNLADGPLAYPTRSGHDTSHHPQHHNHLHQRKASQPSTTPEDPLRLPIVLYDQRPQPFQYTLSAFAFASSASHSNSTHFIGVSRDTANPGTSGQKIEIIELLDSQYSGFTSESLVVPTEYQPTGFKSFNLKTPESDAARAALEAARESPAELAREGDDILDGTPTFNEQRRLDRGRSLSLSSVLAPLNLTNVERSQTPRPPGASALRTLSRVRAEATDVDIDGLAALAKDQSIILRDRVEQGYGASAITNATLGEEMQIDTSMAEFWKWIARAEVLARDACLLDFDFRFRGVISILLGFPASSSNSQRSAKTPSSSTPSARSTYSDITRSLRIGDEARQKNAAYAAAANALVSRRKIDKTFSISASSFPAQRKLALQCCGSDWEEDWEVVCQRFVQRGDYASAARHAFFSGRLEPAMNYLRGCTDENLRLLAPVLAAYVVQKESAKGSDNVYADLCRSLSSDAETPWVRAMFAYLASGDWRECLDESALALKDRAAVALRFLDDTDLVPFLQEIGKEALGIGDLEAVILFGLRGDGLDLISNFVDRTADVQTAAIASSFVYPGIFRDNRRVSRWIESYRTMLDSMELYTARAIFDAAQGRRSRVAMEQARTSGRNTEANSVAAALRRTAPPQMLLRCTYCSENITVRNPSSFGDRGGLPTAGVKANMCPTCNKGLPNCSVCLTKPTVYAFGADGSSSMCWCQNCRHGGHVAHILEWFEKSEVCPVTDCDCRCRAG